ncbi:MAG: multicopper oxidase domain-containing protein [Armatimonadota bacterium]|nr:multicopper oxidase domain-containing protein [Armatimonadota bacterium]
MSVSNDGKFVTAGMAVALLVAIGVLAGRPLWSPRPVHHDHVQHQTGAGGAPVSQAAHPTPQMFMDVLMGGPLGAQAARAIAAAVPAMQPSLQPRITKQGTTTVREYTLEISEKTIDYGGGNAWTVWTYNGTVPAPTLRVKLGELLRVRVVNKHTRVHSFHTHLSYYPIENDGSQANIINNKGAGAMIPPGREYTYQFKPERAEMVYYHCHSGDKEFPINQHMLQGLYGIILVEDPGAPAMREEILFMAETTRLRKGTQVPPYVMNGLGVPGGELALEEIYKKEGLRGIVAQLGKTVPFYKLKINETIKLHVVNIGNLDHSLHIHEIPMISLGVLGGRPWPAQVLPLVGGAADTLQITFKNPGIWLFHCHVVSHADAGMIGVFIVE